MDCSQAGGNKYARAARGYDRLPEGEDARLVRQALALSAHIVVRDKTQLAGQLAGRLHRSTRAAIARFGGRRHFRAVDSGAAKK